MKMTKLNYIYEEYVHENLLSYKLHWTPINARNKLHLSFVVELVSQIVYVLICGNVPIIFWKIIIKMIPMPRV